MYWEVEGVELVCCVLDVGFMHGDNIHTKSHNEKFKGKTRELRYNTFKENNALELLKEKQMKEYDFYR